MRRRPLLLATVACLVVIPVIAIGTWRLLADPAVVLGPVGGSATLPDASPTPRPTPVPIPGHEVYGFVPYWEMDDGIAAHLADTPLTTVGLFSVTNTSTGSIDRSQNGYRKIAGPIGDRLIGEAHERGVRIELVYTSFGARKNAAFFGDPDLQAATVKSLVDLAGDLGVDGINVDVEGMDLSFVPSYGGFVRQLREALVAAAPMSQVSVATTAGNGGAVMARVAIDAGAARVFVMGYDYHSAGSEPGASAPLDRADGGERDLRWTLDRYYGAGVPVERTILGLPLYGVSWPVSGPHLGADRVGRGAVWVPRRNLEALADPSASPVVDPVEVVEFVATRTAEPGVWRAVYYDSPATLTPKLQLANDRGLAGAGFWAIGYERGLPGYTALIEAFRSDRLKAEGP